MDHRIVSQEILDFYTRQSPMSSPGVYAGLFDELPNDLSALVRVVQGLAVHEFVADLYGVSVTEERRPESHIRPLERRLECLLGHDPRLLAQARPAEKRIIGVCHQFALLLTSMLRAKGIPARSRCGFAAYLNPGWYEDHWVCEYWNAAQARWVLVDSQIDERWQVGLDDPLDVPRDRFLVAGDAWRLCRSGHADPARLGIFRGDLRGLWFIAGDLVRDLAAFNKVEMLPWDCWGAMPRPDGELNDEQVQFFDRLAALTCSPDASFEELRALYENHDGLKVPEMVFNAVLQRPEFVEHRTAA